MQKLHQKQAFNAMNCYLKSSSKNQIRYTKQSLCYTQKRGFFQGGGRFQFLSPIVKYSVIGSFGIYLIGMGMNQNEYVRTFLYQHNNFRNGSLHTILTTHFTKTGVIDLIIDNLILVGFSTSIAVFGSEVLLTKLILSGMGISSLILLLIPHDNYFIKADSLTRTLVWYLIFMNPNTKFMLFPFPVQIKAFYIGIFIAVVDLLNRKHCNFGGAAAAYLVLNRRI